MVSMGIYVSNFNLTRQQDAAEVLLHLLSSLEMEYLDHREPFCSSMADIDSFSSSICHFADGRHNKLRKWQQQVLGPFDGTAASMLVCTRCSSQLSMDFDVFHCLPLSPVLNGNQTIMDGCSVEDCLNQYTAAEHLQGYHCSHCWHLNALKFLSLSAKDNNVSIETINRCAMLHSCDCKKLLDFEIPESSCSSYAFKQCCIARAPKILCLHVQRASISQFGEFIKLEGHISFPVILDLFPFTITSKEVFLENFEVYQRGFLKPKEARPHISHFNKQLSMHTARFVNEHKAQSRLKELPENGLGHFKNNCIASSSNHSLGGDCDDRDTMLDPTFSMHQKRNEKVCEESDSKAVTSYLYCLVAVVEHYGRCGSGHYAVYRRMHPITSQCSPDAMRNLTQHWIYVSDSKVSRVSLETVLSAEANLLFYEKIMQ